MAFPGNIYAPPGVYTRTLFEDPTQAILSGLKLPVYIGTGSEILTQAGLELVRGSSSSVDQQVVQEDMDGRSVVSISQAGAVTLGDFNGTRTRVQVRNFPIVTGDGTGTTATRSTSVSVTLNGNPIVVLSIDGARGILELSTPPELGDEVRVTYFFNRTDTAFTDDLSEQVTADAAQIIGAVGEDYQISTGVNDEFIVVVDEDTAQLNITLPESSPSLPWSASQLAAFINTGAAGTSLVATTTINNFGDTVIVLTADQDITIGNGSVNSTLGFTNGASTARNRRFFTFQRPIVDGSNGGVTTTDTSDVTVLVNGLQVIPTEVDGTTGLVVLPSAPAAGSVVTVGYFHNTWQNTFDYLAHRNITDIFQAGITPDRQDFVDGVDFILQNDLILWGTAVTVSAGEHTAGTEFFQGSDADGGGQISTTLVDAKQYLAPTSGVTDTSVNPPVTSRTQFQLPLVPTTGNGRSSPLGSSLFSSVSNGRIDLPTDRPDLVTAYWGFSIQDAIERGPVPVVKVDSDTATITLQNEVPVGASVWATFYYNTVQDATYTFVVETPGAAGVGTYSVRDEEGVALLSTTFGSKGTGLTGISVNFPSGSESLPRARHESPFDTTLLDGPVEEDVTVTFRNKDSTLAKFTTPGAGPYELVAGASDRFRLLVNNSDLVSAAAGINLDAINGVSGAGFTASMVGEEVSYDADSGATTYEIDSLNREVALTLDGVLIQSSANLSTTGTLADYVSGINRAAAGEQGVATAGGATSITLAAGASDVDDYYNGWTLYIRVGAEAGNSFTVTDYDGSTLVATLDSGTFSGADEYTLFDSAARPQYTAAARFNAPLTVTAGEYDSIQFSYTGDVAGTVGPVSATLPAGTYTSATTLAAALDTAVSSALGVAGADINVDVSANAAGQLVFSLTKDPTDTVGYLEFLDFTSGAAVAASGTIVINVAALAPGDIITIGGVPLTANAGVARTPGADDFDPTTPGSAIALGAEITAALNDGANSFTGVVAATDNLDGTVTVTAVTPGSAGNATTLATTLGTPTDITLSGPTLLGGADAGAVAATGSVTVNVAALTVGDIITIGGNPLVGVGGARTPGSDDFDVTLGSAILTAGELTAAINDFSNSFATSVVATDNLDGSFTLTAINPGSAGNLITLATTLTTSTDVTLSGSSLSGGSDGGVASDFSVLAGIDTSDAGVGGDPQTKLLDGPVARRFSIAGDNTGSLLHDRLILRNRLLPGSGSLAPYHQVDQAQLLIEGSTGAAQTGLTVASNGLAGVAATVQPASLLGVVGFSGGQATGFSDERDSQPVVTFYAAGGTTPQNNVFKFTMDGVPVTVEFTDATGTAIATGSSADVPLGPVDVANTVLNQIAEGMASAGLVATASAAVNNLVWQEGAGIRLVSGLDTTVGTIEIGAGNANDDLGFLTGDIASRALVQPEVLASALMHHTDGSSPGEAIIGWEAPTATYFAAEAIASVSRDAANAEYLFLQSLGNGGVGLGVGNSLAFDTPTTASILLPGTGLGVEDGDGSSGEAGVSGFFVTSSDPVSGSGSANTSILNDGSGGSGIGNEGDGQDGVVGQTYRDAVTGLTFTILPRDGNLNYPGASLTDSFVLKVRRVVTTDSNLPITSIPGLEVLVTNTQGIGAGDTALVQSFRRNGAEPAVGDVYFVSYDYLKDDYSTKLYTKFSNVEAEYGTLSPDNPVTLAAYLALLNGAVLVGVKQVQKDVDSNADGIPDSASELAFVSAVQDLEGALPGGILPDILVPLKGDSADLFALLAAHADVQSSIRYRAERTVIAGVSAGTQPSTIGDLAEGIQRTRFRFVYPDIATLTLPRANGLDEETLVDGTFIAAALAGSVVSPNFDVATPWTNRRLTGFNQLARILDAVEQNQVAVRGVTVIEDRPPFLRVRQGLTTQFNDNLLRLPTIQLIVDETQRQARNTLERFIGVKFLPGILSQIEGQLSNTLKQLVNAQILNAYTGVSADVDPDDPTVINAEAFIQPVFPVLYIVVTFNLRSSL